MTTIFMIPSDDCADAMPRDVARPGLVNPLKPGRVQEPS
jgi:hypothetical protein